MPFHPWPAATHCIACCGPHIEVFEKLWGASILASYLLPDLCCHSPANSRNKRWTKKERVNTWTVHQGNSHWLVCCWELRSQENEQHNNATIFHPRSNRIRLQVIVQWNAERHLSCTMSNTARQTSMTQPEYSLVHFSNATVKVGD